MAISVRMDDLLEKELELTAKRRGITKSQFIIEAVERALGHKDPYRLLLKVREKLPADDADATSPRYGVVPRSPLAAIHDRVHDKLMAKHAADTADWLAAHGEPSPATPPAPNPPAAWQQVKVALVDSGPLVALFDPSEAAHAHYERMLADVYKPLRLYTTWPCIVEASYLLGPRLRTQLLEWISLGGLQVFAFDAGDLLDMVGWMQRYTEPRKSEMDFADASLYWLASETGISEILTIDVKDFARYRLPDGRAFELH